MGAKILCATSYPTHETRGWCGRRFFLGIPFSAKQASNRGIDAPAFFDFFFSTVFFSALFVLTSFSTLFVTVFVQYNSSNSSVAHMGSFLLLHSTGAFYFYIVLGQILVTCRGSGAAEGSGFLHVTIPLLFLWPEKNPLLFLGPLVLIHV